MISSFLACKVVKSNVQPVWRNTFNCKMCSVFCFDKIYFFTSKLIVNHWFNGLLMFFADVISDINVD